MADEEAHISEDQGQSSCQDKRLFSTEINYGILSSVNITKGLCPAEYPLLLATKNETCFGHFSGGSLYCSHLKALQRHVLISTELKLTQECLKRFACALNFKKKLESYAEHELSRLNGIYCHELSKNRRLNLDYYHKICKEAKTHLNHWQRLEYKLTHQSLPPRHIIALRARIQKFKRSFLCLRRKILHWLHMIAIAGVRVLANASFRQLSSTIDLQNFLQGIEEFNHIVSAEMKLGYDSKNLYSFNNRDQCSALNSALPSLNIVEILSTICIERSKLLAKLTHEHFVQESKAVELQDFLSTARFSWNADGHLSTQDLLECTANVRYGKLQSVIKKYGQKEEEFIKQLMGTASVCAFLHHETEIRRRSGEFCQEHNQWHGCECNPAQMKCLACQMKQTSINALMDGSEYIDHSLDLEEASEESYMQENHGSNQDLRALFMESKPTKEKYYLFDVYRDDLWNRFALEFYSSLKLLRWPYDSSTTIGPVCCWSTAVVVGIMQHLDNLAATGPFTEVGNRSVQCVCHSLYLRSVLSALDSLHCLMIAVGHTDKCKPTPIVDDLSSTKTTGLMVQACSVFQHFFSTTSYWEEFTAKGMNLNSSVSLTLRIEDVFDRFGLFLDYCIFWFSSKVKRFHASWALPLFFVVSQYELSLLMKSINTTLQLMEQMHCQLGNVSDNAMALKCHWNEMERKAGFLQIIEVESWENFKHKFIKLASDFWQEMMPKGRLWKRSRNSGSLPSEPSSYVEHAIIQVLQPVIEGVSQLPQSLQTTILVPAVEIMMDTWSSHILKEQIKFSVVGASQLQVDFNYVKLWLMSEASTLSNSIQTDLATLDVFRHLNEAVRLLMIQPKNKRKRLVVSENGLEQELESNLSTISGSSVLSGSSSYDGEVDLLNNQPIPNKDQWLNLRLRKGKRRMPLVIPGCLKAEENS